MCERVIKREILYGIKIFEGVYKLGFDNYWLIFFRNWLVKLVKKLINKRKDLNNFNLYIEFYFYKL